MAKKTEKETKNKNIHDVEVKIEGNSWDTAIDKIFEKKQKTVKVDGFRKGKVPRNIYEKKFGKESLYIDAADLVVKLQALQSKTKLFRGGGGNAFLQCIYSDVTVDTQECKIFQTNFTNISKSISNQRMSVSGVDEDEEALDLMKFQNAYNLASKCISTFAEIYDRLILNTGV